MNRLILLGNGFDLAHKLKTSYKDFIVNYLSQCFKKAVTEEYSDDLVQIYSNARQRDIIFPEDPTVEDILLALVDNGGNYMRIDDFGSPFRNFKLKIKHEFIEHVFTQCASCNWVNIENEYFAFLKNIFYSMKESGQEKMKIKLESLNSSMQGLIRKLDAYFVKQEHASPSKEYREIFTAEFKKNEYVSFPKTGMHLTHPIETLVLNFNYTKTAENYKRKGEFRINNIHGLAGDVLNPIIFGFGDEMDKDYNDMELHSNKGFLKFMKSFGYFNTSNYHNLLRFIGSDTFEVFILGHSCGLSDRTLLNMIFEHQNCISIKIFYHQKGGGDNHRDLTEEISKQFRDKIMMRSKIVPHVMSQKMPQL